MRRRQLLDTIAVAAPAGGCTPSPGRFDGPAAGAVIADAAMPRVGAVLAGAGD